MSETQSLRDACRRSRTAAGRAGTRPQPRPVGHVSFLVSEVAFFSTLIVVYLTFLGTDTVRPDAGGAVAAAGDRHDRLPAVQQRDDSSGGEVAAAAAIVSAAFRPAGGRPRSCWACSFLLGTAYEWTSLIIAARPDHQPQPVRDHVLHPGRLPCPARDGRRDRHAHRARADSGPSGDGREPARRRAGVVVLALCGRRLGGGLHGGLPGGTGRCRVESLIGIPSE